MREENERSQWAGGLKEKRESKCGKKIKVKIYLEDKKEIGESQGGRGMTQ